MVDRWHPPRVRRLAHADDPRRPARRVCGRHCHATARSDHDRRRGREHAAVFPRRTDAGLHRDRRRVHAAEGRHRLAHASQREARDLRPDHARDHQPRSGDLRRERRAAALVGRRAAPLVHLRRSRLSQRVRLRRGVEDVHAADEGAAHRRGQPERERGADGVHHRHARDAGRGPCDRRRDTRPAAHYHHQWLARRPRDWPERSRELEVEGWQAGGGRAALSGRLHAGSQGAPRRLGAWRPDWRAHERLQGGHRPRADVGGAGLGRALSEPAWLDRLRRVVDAREHG